MSPWLWLLVGLMLAIGLCGLLLLLGGQSLTQAERERQRLAALGDCPEHRSWRGER